MQPPRPALGAAIASYLTRLDVTVLAAGDRPTDVTLQATVALAGGAAPGRYALRVTAAVRGGELILTSWSLGP